MSDTPAARWNEENKPNPHGDRYDCKRCELHGGQLTDFELANEVFLSPNIANLTSAKDRIRWLSVQLINTQHELMLAQNKVESMQAEKKARPNEQGQNAYGLDMAYFRNLIDRELNIPLDRHTPEELARVFARASKAADPSVMHEPEFCLDNYRHGDNQ